MALQRAFTLTAMFVRFHRFVLLALLLTVPLQGLASVVHALACAPDGHHAATTAPAGEDAHAHHHHAGHDHGTPHQHPEESGGTSGDHASHQCCHHFSAAPVTAVSQAPTEHSVYQSSLTLLELSFVPEQPQRPPRS